MPALFIDGGSLSNDINGESIIYNSSVNSFSGFSLQYLYHSGNILYRYGTGISYPDCYYIGADSGIFLNNYPFYRIITSGIPVNNIIYTDTDPCYSVYNPMSGIVYFTNTGYITLSTINNDVTHSLYVRPNVIITTPQIRINPKPFNPSEHLLICYNSRSQDSTDIKSYYLQTRPELATANVLGIDCNIPTSGEMTDIYDYLNNIRPSIVSFLSTSTKPIRYITMLYDIGIRITGNNINYQSIYGWSLARRDQYPLEYSGTYVADGTVYNELLATYYDLAPNQAKSNNFVPMLSVPTSLRVYFYLNDLTGNYISGLRNNIPIEFSESNTLRYDGDIFNAGENEFNIDGYITQANSLKPWKHYSIGEFRNSILITYVTAKNKNDVSGYIRKIGDAQLYNSYYRRGNKPVKNFYLVGKGVQNNSGQKTFDELVTLGEGAGYFAKDLTGICNGINVKACLPNYSLNGFADINLWVKAPVISGRDIAGFHHHGAHTTDALWLAGLSNAVEGEYTYNKQCMITGDNWYVLTTSESFNGMNYVMDNSNVIYPQETIVGGQGTIFNWLSSGAFGGTGYENCPVGACVHPYEMGMNVKIPPLMAMWFSGYPFIECGYAAIGYGNYNAFGPYIVGDPLVVI